METIKVSTLLKGRTNRKKKTLKEEEFQDEMKTLLGMNKKKKTLIDYNLHRFIKCKLDSYDKEIEAELFLTGKYYYSEKGIRIFRDKIYFDNLDKRFEKLKKWTIADYIEYYLYMTQICRTIMVYRNGKYVRLTPSMAYPQEMELLSKLSNGLRRIEKIVTDYFDHYSNVTYDSLIPEEYKGLELPLLK